MGVEEAQGLGESLQGSIISFLWPQCNMRYVCTCIYIYADVCMYVCIYVCTYIDLGSRAEGLGPR